MHFFHIACQHFDCFWVEFVGLLGYEPDAVVALGVVYELVSAVSKVGVVYHVAVDHCSLNEFQSQILDDFDGRIITANDQVLMRDQALDQVVKFRCNGKIRRQN